MEFEAEVVAEVDRQVDALLCLVEDETVTFEEIIARMPGLRHALEPPAVKVFHERCRERMSRHIENRNRRMSWRLEAKRYGCRIWYEASDYVGPPLGESDFPYRERLRHAHHFHYRSGVNRLTVGE